MVDANKSSLEIDSKKFKSPTDLAPWSSHVRLAVAKLGCGCAMAPVVGAASSD